MANMELKNNTGTAFTNRKTKDTQPDFKGELNVEGKVWQVAVWSRVSKNGNKYLSMKVEMRGVPEEKPQETKTTDYIEDDIPWN